jgi:hypothetical protein
MSLIELKIEPALLKRLLSCLEIIADSLERAYPHVEVRKQMRPFGVEALSQFDPEAEFERQEEESRQRENGQIPSS